MADFRGSVPLHPAPEYDLLRVACTSGGFRDPAETERVSRWALDEINRLRAALEEIADLWQDSTVGEFWRVASRTAREALEGPADA